ncbi:MAG: sigma-54-dependent Fis family transcriptional regulator, partial [Nitrospirota bacterium]
TGDGSPELRIGKVLALVKQARGRGLAEIKDQVMPSALSQVIPQAPESLTQPASIGKRRKQFPQLIGESLAMSSIYEAIERVGESQATVLIRGESGTGKELVAQAIHQASVRNKGPFVPVHCAALPESLIESALFGYERGAFTGAVQMRKGKVDQASGGTLFLDEVGDIPVNTQVKLLRVLQERQYERVGGLTTLPADIRVLAATHRDLEAMVESGTFREDLYYRLNVVPIRVPPLRERKEDIPTLVKHFLDRFNRENRRQVKLGPDVMAIFARYHWPGNVRELQNCIERLVVLADSSTLTITAIPKPLRSYIDHIKEVTSTSRPSSGRKAMETLPAHVQNIEREQLIHVLKEVAWNKAKAGRRLGLTARQVAYKVQKYAIGKPLKAISATP